MKFRNTIRLLLTNFSCVWKVLLYYVICVAVFVGVCWAMMAPIVEALKNANVFADLYEFFKGFFSGIEAGAVAKSLNDILSTAWDVIYSSFKFNYIFLIVWILFVFPYALDLAQLAMGEILYGYMTSQVKYGFTGRFIKNIGKSCVYSLVRYFVMLPFNALSIGIIIGIIKIAALGGFFNILLALLVFAVLVMVTTLKHTFVSCWMPGIAVRDYNVFKALKQNFKLVFKKFFSIFSNYLTIIICAIALNIMFAVFTFTTSLVITLPLTALVFVIFQMVSYFTVTGMRFYVYPDMFITPQRFEEQDKIKKLKYLI